MSRHPTPFSHPAEVKVLARRLFGSSVHSGTYHTKKHG